MRRAYVASRRVALPEAAYDRYAGSYAVAGGGTVTIARDGDHLALVSGSEPPRALYPESPTTFFFGTTDATVVFDRDGSGRVRRATFVQAGRRTVATRAP
jgi:hypothetical protein